ncbi:hypothetical protein HN446_03560 [bacterium]|jgi:hypothetical protein|nr:hypothetical protein [bacterium]
MKSRFFISIALTLVYIFLQLSHYTQAFSADPKAQNTTNKLQPKAAQANNTTQASTLMQFSPDAKINKTTQSQTGQPLPVGMIFLDKMRWFVDLSTPINSIAPIMGITFKTNATTLKDFMVEQLQKNNDKPQPGDNQQIMDGDSVFYKGFNFKGQTQQNETTSTPEQLATHALVWSSLALSHLISASGENPAIAIAGKSRLLNQYNKYSSTSAGQVLSKKTFIGFLRTKNNFSPADLTAIFSGDKYKDLLTSFNGLMANLTDDNGTTVVEKAEDFLVYFYKIHFATLHEIYEYLRNIYINFNLSHKGTTETGGGETEGLVKVDMPTVLGYEKTHAINEKTLIINHMTNVIESQCSGVSQHLFKGVSKNNASSVGRALMQHDTSASLDLLVMEQEEGMFTRKAGQTGDIGFKKMKAAYMDSIGEYLNFQKNYTGLLDIPGTNDDPYLGIDTFYAIAELLKEKFEGTTFEDNNPNFFFFSNDTLRGVKVIPQIAKTMDAITTKTIGWPTVVVNNAITQEKLTNTGGIPVSPLPKAYFTDANGNITKDEKKAQHLYMNIITKKQTRQQELVGEPEWMKGYANTISMLKSCLGNFMEITGAGILDPVLEYIFANAAYEYNKKVGSLVLTNQFLTTNETNITDKQINDLLESAKTYLNVVYGIIEKTKTLGKAPEQPKGPPSKNSQIPSKTPLPGMGPASETPSTPGEAPGGLPSAPIATPGQMTPLPQAPTTSTQSLPPTTQPIMPMAPTETPGAIGIAPLPLTGIGMQLGTTP